MISDEKWSSFPSHVRSPCRLESIYYCASVLKIFSNNDWDLAETHSRMHLRFTWTFAGSSQSILSELFIALLLSLSSHEGAEINICFGGFVFVLQLFVMGPKNALENFLLSFLKSFKGFLVVPLLLRWTSVSSGSRLTKQEKGHHEGKTLQKKSIFGWNVPKIWTT